MNSYRLTVLTPLLVGDGQRLAPIDYMVWKDQVNVLDQRRIFRLLAKGPRLDTYLAQIAKAEKLDFASWGGYAQNYASRRIPFEHPSSAQYYARTAPENLFIPTFATAPAGGIYIPGSALKGPLRTALLMDRTSEAQWRDLAARWASPDRPARRVCEMLETTVLGPSGQSRTRPFLVSDSKPVPPGGLTRVYLLRTATLLQRGSRLELGWQMSPRGAVEARRPSDSTPTFAEMAMPGAVFEGTAGLSAAFRQGELTKTLRWKEAAGAERFTAAANTAAERLLEVQLRYAEMTGLGLLAASINKLSARLAELRSSGQGCLCCLGWGAGFLAKSASADVNFDPFRQILRSLPVYTQPLRSGLPFPKTRRIVFLNDQPAALPGWVELSFAS